MKVLVTGAAGFIGYHLSKKLLEKGFEVIGLDNINNYYDVNLKYARLRELGISKEDAELFNKVVTSNLFESFKFYRLNLEDREELFSLFKNENFDIVCNLAAQAGVRYSIQNPETYIQSNIVGFANILECCRHNKIKHLLYASSSSVYGANKKTPFETSDSVDYSVSLYAATKKSNELMAHTYSHLYGLPTTGLRFFTVYGEWGRPDMAIYLFADAVLKNKSIKVFNKGDMSRDFTYISDIISGINILINNPPKLNKGNPPYAVYNIGNGASESLKDFILEIENSFDVKIEKEYLPMQPGDVPKTWASISELEKLGYKSETNIKEGVKRFVDWFKLYHKI